MVPQDVINTPQKYNIESPAKSIGNEQDIFELAPPFSGIPLPSQSVQSAQKRANGLEEVEGSVD